MKAQPRRRKHVLGRFGWKIMAALLVTALVPLLAAVVLFELVIAAEVNVLRGESELARVPIESASRAYQALFAARKHEFHEAAEQLGRRPESSWEAPQERRSLRRTPRHRHKGPARPP